MSSTHRRAKESHSPREAPEMAERWRRVQCKWPLGKWVQNSRTKATFQASAVEKQLELSIGPKSLEAHGWRIRMREQLWLWRAQAAAPPHQRLGQVDGRQRHWGFKQLTPPAANLNVCTVPVRDLGSCQSPWRVTATAANPNDDTAL